MVRGRFAPSPTGVLHAGSLVAALASWLDARALQGEWWVRIEDIDGPRCIAGAAEKILNQLSACGLHSDSEVAFQSHRNKLYQDALDALDALIAKGLVYPCACTRKEIEEQQAALGLGLARHKAAVYPGTCRKGLNGKPARAWRFDVHQWSALRGSPVVHWNDRRLGPQSQNVLEEVGDFVLKRADGLWAYQLAVVVDDAAQGITHVVRGEDLADNTARQILLQRQLGLATPRYLHTPLVRNAQGEKLSKQTGAPALDTGAPLAALNAAAGVLGLLPVADNVGDALASWVAQWLAKWPLPDPQPGQRLYNPAL
jgi:glutamyl-Q tRNA(Asp) synthetase